MHMRPFLTCSGLVSLVATGAMADELFAKSYDMLNGEIGSFTYLDDSYNGSGNPGQSGSALSGGLGDLTDGIIANQNWFSTPGPYVGWRDITPIITFRFDGVVNLDTVTFYFDDSNNNGGVSSPGAVRLSMGGVTLDIIVFDGASGAPIQVDATDLDLTGDTLDVTIFDGTDQWVFCSEVKFNGTIPAPGALAGFGLAALALGRRRR